MGVKKTRWKLKNRADKAYHQEKIDFAKRIIETLVKKIYPDLEEKEAESLREFMKKKREKHSERLKNTEEEKRKTFKVSKKTKIRSDGKRMADERFVEEVLGKLDEVLIGKSMVPE